MNMITILRAIQGNILNVWYYLTNGAVLDNNVSVIFKIWVHIRLPVRNIKWHVTVYIYIYYIKATSEYTVLAYIHILHIQTIWYYLIYCIVLLGGGGGGHLLHHKIVKFKHLKKK
jgi:hypothetical protein